MNQKMNDGSFMERSKPILDKKQAALKLQHYCAYQERSQQEARDKLYDLGLHSRDVEEVISDLIQENFLNEERFSIAYAQGKFRIKHWGRIKIKQALKLKKVSDKLIIKALKSIDDDDYMQTLELLLDKKAALVKEKDAYKERYKLVQYALGRGFEHDLILDVLKNKGLK